MRALETTPGRATAGPGGWLISGRGKMRSRREGHRKAGVGREVKRKGICVGN